MAVFTTWVAEKTKVENQIAELNERLLDVSWSAESKSRAKRSLNDIQSYYTWVCRMAANETGTSQTSRIKLADVS
jgi:hypothetical protein